MDSPRHSARRALGRVVLTCTLIIGLYYVVPIEYRETSVQVALRAIATLVAGVVITWLIVRQISHHLTRPGSASLADLSIALVGGVAFFALVDYIIAVSDPGQFTGLETKTDGLYFALATVTSVGYGDVYAHGQLARAVVAVQLLFNVVVVAVGASVLTRGLGSRVRERRVAGPPPDR